MRLPTFLFCLLLFICFPVFAQTPITIDIPALIGIGGTIFLAGIAGLPVMGIVALIKRILNAHGLWVMLISLIISAGCVVAYLIPVGWDIIQFIILTLIVFLSANGIHLGSKRRIPK